MRFIAIPVCVCLTLCVAPVRGESLDDFLADPARAHDLKSLGLTILTQIHPDEGQRNVQEIRKSFWATRPAAGLSAAERAAAVQHFDATWQQIGDLVRADRIRSLSFAGLQPVLLGKAQEWYFAAFTPRGPVLFKFCVQFNDQAPLTIMDVQVWTRWDDVKATYAAVQFKPNKVATITYGAAATTPATTQSATPAD